MFQAKCALSSCNCSIIKVNESDTIKVHKDVFDTFKLMQNKSTKSSENYTNFLIVRDVWDFDNIGVSKDIPPTVFERDFNSNLKFDYEGTTWNIQKCVKYLICADCDKGPIGIVCETTDDSEKSHIVYMLSLDSVNYSK